MSLPRRLPTSARVALAVTSVLVAGVVVLCLLAYLGTSRGLAQDADRALAREADSFAVAVAADPSRDASGLVDVSRDYLTSRTGPDTGARPILTVRFASGSTMSNSSLGIESAGEDRVLTSPDSATRGFHSIVFRGVPYRVAVMPVKDSRGIIVAVFQAALSEQPARAVASELALTLAAAGLTVVLAGAALSAFVAKASLRPLRHAARTASEVTVSSLGKRIAYDGADDDVGQMVTALNAMLDRLEAAFAEQRYFVADASHELRTPLAVVRGNLELLAGNKLSPEDRAEAVAMAFSELDRMTRLVDDLLALARLDANGVRGTQPVELGTLAAEAAARGRALAYGQCAVEAAPEAVWVRGDPDGLMQAVLNLVRNAQAHTPDEGVVTVASRREGSRAIIEVSDTGTGIPAADLPRIFDRFYRACGPRRADTGGSGLGLAIVRRLVELHRGQVTARNRDGGGAVFRIELPAIDEPRDADAATAPGATPSAPARRRRAS